MNESILIVDDLATNRIILKVKLNAACYQTLQASTGAEALRLAREKQPKLILLDMVLPDVPGIEICRRVRADPATRHIPIVMITAASDRVSRLAALEAGADEYLTKPLNDVVLLARIRSILRARQNETEMQLRLETWGEFDLSEGETPFTRPGRVSLIAADTATAGRWRDALAPHVSARMDILSPSEALSPALDGLAPDLYLIAETLGAFGSGQRLIADLRARPASRHAAIAFVLQRADPDAAAMALDFGATDLLSDPFDPQETALRIAMHVSRKQRADKLRRAVSDGLRLAVTDALTGLYNRRYALSYLDRLANRARLNGTRFAVMVLDLDRFKTVNDTLGHAAGDRVLETLAQRLRENLRPSDLIARIGGEEFLVVLPDVTIDSASRTAERLCRAVGAAPVVLGDGHEPVEVTISVGLAMGPALSVHDDGEIGRETLARADAALLAAKTDGRNQVTIGSAA
ncbi:diguanylate cyclase domain-containing protein [Pararhodobacter marinus]|uniref:diguanylate cyclase domain-containing protein n=1 Tax=Pararhodobacter marinus TaxID=2184063 RepID=UPI0035177470